MLTLDGLENCDTCRTARKWLEAEGIGHRFVDLRQQPPAADMIAKWIDELGAEALINRRSTTWRALGAEDKARGESHPAALIGEHLALLKLPLIDFGAVRRAFGPRRLEAVDAFVRADNLPSLRVLERAGVPLREEIDVGGPLLRRHRAMAGEWRPPS